MNEATVRAFFMTLAAGLSTGFGGCAAFLARRTNQKFLCACLGFSAGVMLYVSMAELFFAARLRLEAAAGARAGGWLAAAGFFGGALLIALIGCLTPSEEALLEARPGSAPSGALLRMGALTAAVIAVHNFPEGLATFVSALQEPGVGIPIAAAVAVHNVPEGVAVSVPIYQATGSRRRAFFYSLLSGLAEPAGALIGWLILAPAMSDAAFGAILACVAGVMAFLSLDELLPAAREYGGRRLTAAGLFAGMAVMAASLLAM